ncbi:MAG: endopeptidase La [Acidobacteria bacterium]|nr:endopeptidase La [Acidobacteriota bacterium]
MKEYTDAPPLDVVRYPVVPVRDVVIFPHCTARFFIGRRSSIEAFQTALQSDRIVFLTTQHDAIVDEPSPDQIYSVGALAQITKSLRLPDGTVKVEVEGCERGRATQIVAEGGHWMATIRRLPDEVESPSKLRSLLGRLSILIDQYMQQYPNADIRHTQRSQDPSQVADLLADSLKLDVEIKQGLLETTSVSERLARLIELLQIEIEKSQLDREINNRVKRQMEKAQREYYLNEKLKAIHKELGRKDEKAELDELKQKIEEAGMPPEAYEKAVNELKRLEQMPPMSAETTVSRNYIDWLLAVPWKKATEEIRDLTFAEAVLNEDHYGLEKIKERILEYLAVRQLVENPKGTILCFVGPPGVGKTSLGRSIARATGRNFIRLSLGGVRDEAEIRGHRRTYIGALPGQIIQMMRKAGTINPLFMLDELDKLGVDFRGDPSAALLEVLDPEQNFMFRDHYLDVEYDLSKVMFIATANVTHTVPPALQDRLEILRLPGYTEYEKLQIAKRHLIPKQLKATGLKPEQVAFLDAGIRRIIQYYTREAGVRNLEREIGSVCRKVARKLVSSSENRDLYNETVTDEDVKSYLGPERFRPGMANERSEVGLATGLAWTEMGGEVLQIEVTLMPGTGKLTLTGKLGEVMQESAQAAISYVRSRATAFNIPTDFHKNFDIHIHIPEGAIPKDGPSAGITIATAIASAVTGTPVRCDVAMTGEITLRGKILPIGGVKEKLLAAHRAGITTLLLPKENQKDLVDIPGDVLSTLNIELVESMDEVMRIALESSLPPVDQASVNPLWAQESGQSSGSANQLAE